MSAATADSAVSRQSEFDSPASKVNGSLNGTADTKTVTFSTASPKLYSSKANGSPGNSVENSPSLQSSSRFSRINGISSSNSAKPVFPLLPGISSAQAESPWTSGYNTPTIGGAIHNVAERAEDALQKLADQQQGKPAGRLLQYLIDAGTALEQRIQYEIFSRVNAIGGLDNMWLLVDGISSFNPVCTATYTFREPVKFEQLKATMDQQMGHFPKYKQKIADAGRFFRGTVFIDDPDFNLDNHVQSHTLPGKAGKQELEKFASEFIAQGWDFSRPLWEVVVLENFVDEESGARGASITRGHHTLADGQGFIMSQLFITSLGPKLESMMADGAQLLSDAKQGKALPSRLNKKLSSLDRFHGSVLLQVFMMALYWITQYISLLTDLAGCFTLAISTSYFFLATFWRQRYVTASYPGPRKHEKEFSVSQSFPLSDVKIISKAFSGAQPGSVLDKVQGGKRYSRPLIGNHLTVNDVICTVIADVINDELDRQPKQPGAWAAFKRFSNKILPSPIGIMIPISIRQPGDWSMRNLSTGGIAYLPTTKGLSTDPRILHKRLHTTHSRLNILKNSLLPKIFFDLIQLTGQAPALWPVPFGILPKVWWNPLRYPTVKVTEMVLTSFTAVVTNVPCPSKQRIKLAGQEVVRWTALPPQAGKGTLGIGICSYGGDVSISISADRVPESEGVAARLTASFEHRWNEYVEASRKLIRETGSEEKSSHRRRNKGEGAARQRRRNSSGAASSASASSSSGISSRPSGEQDRDGKSQETKQED
ncbi:hypothetical protein BCV70DRAFT_198011 [Testicularia cyperi]|uniref:Uncharacterized protein n=1 Tax=Testicularia cyperi TaxID=1882483 RepID=A0A317Y0B9_9BASI|nr:hypothetical protein BCV70DRAFT_198011 [Testicularia cyperi]